MGPRPNNGATIWARTFSGMRKSAAFPYYRLTAAFPGFASDRLAEAFRGHSLVCPADGSSQTGRFEYRKILIEVQFESEL